VVIAFWTLLEKQYSPENYDAEPIQPGTVGFACLGVALVVAGGI
jgi:hypothetical protein